MGNHYLSKINVRFFKDDGSPDVEIAERIYDEFQEIIEADYEGMSVKDVLITSEGFFYDEGIGGCIKCLKEKAPDCIFQGLYYLKDEYKSSAAILSFHSNKPLDTYDYGDSSYNINSLVDEDGYWTGLEQDDASATVEYDEDDNEDLGRDVYTDETHTNVKSKKLWFQKNGGASEEETKNMKFYSVKTAPFKKAMLLADIEKYASENYELSIRVISNSLYLTGKNNVVKLQTEAWPDIQMGIRAKALYEILKNASDEGTISFGFCENLNPDIYESHKAFIRYDDKEVQVYANQLLEIDPSFKKIKKQNHKMIFNRVDLLTSLEELFNIAKPAYEGVHDSYLYNSHQIDLLVVLEQKELSISLDVEKTIPVENKQISLHAKQKIKLLYVEGISSDIKFTLPFTILSMLNSISSEKIIVYFYRKWFPYFEPEQKPEYLEYYQY